MVWVLGNTANLPNSKWSFLRTGLAILSSIATTQPKLNTKTREPRVWLSTSCVPKSLGVVIPAGKQSKTEQNEADNLSPGRPVLVGVPLKTFFHQLGVSSSATQDHDPPAHSTVFHMSPQTLHLIANPPPLVAFSSTFGVKLPPPETSPHQSLSTCGTCGLSNIMWSPWTFFPPKAKSPIQTDNCHFFLFQKYTCQSIICCRAY